MRHLEWAVRSTGAKPVRSGAGPVRSGAGACKAPTLLSLSVTNRQAFPFFYAIQATHYFFILLAHADTNTLCLVFARYTSSFFTNSIMKNSSILTDLCDFIVDILHA